MKENILLAKEVEELDILRILSKDELLDVLTPTSSEGALDWRNNCRKYLELKTAKKIVATLGSVYKLTQNFKCERTLFSSIKLVGSHIKKNTWVGVGINSEGQTLTNNMVFTERWLSRNIFKELV